MTGRRASRRRVILLCGAGLAGLAGCSQSQPEGAAGDGEPATETATPTAIATATATAATTVEIVASYPVQSDGQTTQRQQTVLTEDDFASVSPAQQGSGGRPPRVPATLTDAGATDFVAAMREYGFTSDEGIGACRYESDPEEPCYCLHTVVDEEIVYSAGMAPGLAEMLESGEFSENPAFVLQTENVSKAEEIAAALRE